MTNDIYINGVKIKTPTEFKIERFKITKAERLASGKMAMELIAKKRKFYFTYSAITAEDLNLILDFLWELDDCFVELQYVESNVIKNATVYVGAIPTNLYRTDIVDWIWTQVTFDLIEQ